MSAVAYLILAHGEPFALCDFLWTVWRETDIYVVHLDRKSPPWSRAAVEALAAAIPNIRLVPSDTVGWFGFTLVEAAHRCLLAAFASQHRWTHAILASATHVPLRGAADLAASLEPGACAFNFHALDLAAAKLDPPTWFSGVASRVTYGYLEVPGLGHLRGPERAPPEGVQIYWGSQWWVLSREAAEFACRQRLGPLANFFRHSAGPDELYFQTLLANSPFKPGLRSRQIIWQRWGENGRPVPLSAPALREALGSTCLFARKSTAALFRGENISLLADIAGVSRAAWSDLTARAWAQFLPGRTADILTQAYGQEDCDHEPLPDAPALALRAAAEDIAGLLQETARARGLMPDTGITYTEGPEARVRCDFPYSHATARYVLSARLCNAELVWLSIHVRAADRVKAMEELRTFPHRELISPDFPPVRGLHPFHDVLADPGRRRGVVPFTDPRDDAQLRQRIEDFVSVLADIPGMLPNVQRAG